MFRVILTALAVLTAAPAIAQVDIQEVTSPGGINAWLVEDHSLPFVALDIRFQGGTSLDAPDHRGATYLMTGLLEEGAGDMNNSEFAARSEALAAYFGFSAYRDSIAITAQMLTENRDQAVDLLHEALVNPRFDQTAIDRVRGQVLSIIDSNQHDPAELASAAFYAQAFGDHPYGSAEEGTPDSVNALTRDDLIAAHRGALARDRVSVGVSGDITPDELGVLLDRLLGDLPETGAPQPADAPYTLSGGTTVIDYPTPQSTALFGHEGIERDDPDFFAAYVLNQVLGGGNFRSRLMQEIRVDRGLTYGISTFLVLFDHGPMMMGQFSSSNDLVAQAVEVLRQQWADVAENGVAEEELEAAKTYLTGAYPLRFTGNENLAAILAGMQADHMPISYINTRNDRVNAVTQDDVRRVAARLMDPEGLRVVVVGQPEGLESTD
ncbi:M16 family metallopeptidase [Nioella nitratireducens]|uniref:M16 family metallopeptidase n=1 Tax=Nioella nitratireducens TaxID=1287720 RepID=UPI0009FE1756|nr:pitrilysin family protein [Nioella nitratireducens]